MSQNMSWTGFIATTAIALILGLYAVLEPLRLQTAQEDRLDDDRRVATDLYAQNCVMCHGNAGEGIAAMPALNNDGLRSMDTEAIASTIARGRYNTAMAAWSVEEGGILTEVQVEQLVTLIQYGDWSRVEQRVADLGLTAPTVIQVEVSPELLTQVSALPDGEVLSQGLTLYAEHCVACHNAAGEGTAIAPAVNGAELRSRMTDADLTRVISEGVSG
ncbi:MAG: c-type cytochrome, partial [Anaerolineae bacterium]|nr:c-type cytochrome [Anaerolineae bacterium]